MTTLKHIDLFFDNSWGNLHFRKCFARPLFFAFALWGQENIQIKKLLADKNFDVLKVKIDELVTKAIGFDRAYHFSGICFKEEEHVLQQVNNIFSDAETELNATSLITSEYCSRHLKLTQNQFLIAELFLNIDRAWTLLECPDPQRMNKYKCNIISCVMYIRELSYSLAQSYIAGQKGEIGRLNRTTKRDACISIIQCPTYLFQRINARNGNPAQDNIQKLKDLYQQIHGAPLQEPNKKGVLTPSDRTIEDWLRAYVPRT